MVVVGCERRHRADVPRVPRDLPQEIAVEAPQLDQHILQGAAVRSAWVSRGSGMVSRS